MRSTVRATNTERGIERRQFLRTAAGGTAGIVLGACKTTTKTDARVTVLTQPPPTSVHDTTLPGDNSAPPITGTLDDLGTVWRLSSRNQRSPCTACKAHAAHRYFVSAEAADAGRAHAGCVCEVRAQQLTMGQLSDWFAEGDEVFDDRWT